MIQQLRNKLHQHNHLYYVVGKPVITDEQYDAMFEKLLMLEQQYPEYADQNSPTQRIGSDISNGSIRLNMKHPAPMLSVKSFYDEQTIAGALPGNLVHGLIVQPKYDGIAVELHYAKGELTRALTRGNGVYGSDITANVRTIGSIPLILPTEENIIIRGETIITPAELKRLNKIRRRNRQTRFNSPRNTVNALVKAMNSTTTAGANIIFIAFSIVSATHETEKETVEKLSRLGFITPPTTQADTPQQAISAAMTTAATPQPFPTDGAMIKINSIHRQQQEGNTKRNHKWAWALKPNKPEYQTTFKYISHTVSKYGVITPIAHFESFVHNGATFSKAKINFRKNPKPGEQITVCLSGGIVPQIDYPNGDTRSMHTCPACHQPLHNERCVNEEWCPSRNHTAEKIKQYTGWNIAVELMVTPGGKAAAQVACMNKNALVVRYEKEKHTHLIITDTLQTLVNVAVTLGEIDPMKHQYEIPSTKELKQQINNYNTRKKFETRFNY